MKRTELETKARNEEEQERIKEERLRGKDKDSKSLRNIYKVYVCEGNKIDRLRNEEEQVREGKEAYRQGFLRGDLSVENEKQD